MDSFVSQSAAAGQFDSVGEFSIDWEKSEQKLGEFYRAHPGLWLLKFVQAGVSFGATDIQVSLSRKSIDITYHLESAEGSLFDLTGPDDHTQHLRTGIRGAFSSLDTVSRIDLTYWPASAHGGPKRLTHLVCPRTSASFFARTVRGQGRLSSFEEVLS